MPKKTKKYHNGTYVPKNPGKWINSRRGIPITYRSAWEKKFCFYLDMNTSILEAGSECIVIPYPHPIKKKIVRYFPDFVITVKETNGMVRKYIIEIKPEKETKRPTGGRKKKSSLFYEQATYAINIEKWKYAEQYAKKMGYIFKIITERELKFKY